MPDVEQNQECARADDSRLPIHADADFPLPSRLPRHRATIFILTLPLPSFFDQNDAKLMARRDRSNNVGVIRWKHRDTFQRKIGARDIRVMHPHLISSQPNSATPRSTRWIATRHVVRFRFSVFRGATAISIPRRPRSRSVSRLSTSASICATATRNPV
jgi:hypothetical protein